jgi:hypothetical protein
MRLSWRDELLYLLLAFMEVAWFWPLLAALAGMSSLQAAVPSVPGFLALLLLALYLARLVLSWRLDLTRSRVLVGYLAAVSFLVALKLQLYSHYGWLDLTWLREALGNLLTLDITPTALVIAIVAYVWWRGLRLGQGRPLLGMVYYRFQAGLVGLIAALLLSNVGQTRLDVAPFIFAYFFCGLLAVAIVRLEAIATDEKRTSLGGYWLSVFLVVTITVLGLGGLAAALFSYNTFQAVIAAFLKILVPIYELLVRVILAIAYVLFMIISFFLSWLLPGSPTTTPTPTPAPTPDLLAEWQKQQAKLVILPPALVTFLKAIVVITVLALILFLLVRTLGRRRVLCAGGVEEVRESIWSSEEFLRGLRRLFQRLWDRLLGRRPVTRPSYLSLLEKGEAYRASLSIRQIYARLLAWAAQHGLSRRPEETPYEYFTDLRRALPEATPDLRAITEAYVHVRYGDLPASVDELQAVRESWERVQKAEIGDKGSRGMRR